MNTNRSIIESVAKNVRLEMEAKYGKGVKLAGRCIEASEILQKRLLQRGINSNTVEGWCIYEDKHYGSNRPYDAHTWVEIESCDNRIYVDVTADQFQPGMFHLINEIIIGEKPEFMVYDEPDID